MYPVSEAFLKAVQSNSRKFYWTGRITTKAGKVYPFGYEDIVKCSGYISSQCCGSTELELGTVYAAEMGITLFSRIDRYTLEDAKVELFYHLRLTDGTQMACITSLQHKIGGKQSLKCVGKNPRLAQAKSKNDKNISGLLNQI